MSREVRLSQGKVALVDDEDYECLSAKKWTLHSCGYAYRWEPTPTGKRMVYMHRFIVERMIGAAIPDKHQVDHINMNGLDNQRGNLRMVTKAQNTMNRKRYRGSTSQYKGVCWNKKEGKWIAQIGLNKQRIRIGAFNNEEEAARAYDAKARELHGEFARPNFP